MTIGTLCSGVGGIDLGFERAGFECKFVVEIDRNCQNVLRRHFPKALLLADMTECGASRTMVRRLTPVECARLQAHPDSWCGWGIDASGQRVEQSDSTQYRQYGNGVTATVLEWIARRIILLTKIKQRTNTTPGML